ncbi:MAG: hypothetical protein WC846_02975 [Candidatus Gracilibacteria bacterium]
MSFLLECYPSSLDVRERIGAEGDFSVSEALDLDSQLDEIRVSDAVDPTDDVEVVRAMLRNFAKVSARREDLWLIYCQTGWGTWMH